LFLNNKNSVAKWLCSSYLLGKSNINVVYSSKIGSTDPKFTILGHDSFTYKELSDIIAFKIEKCF